VDGKNMPLACRRMKHQRLGKFLEDKKKEKENEK